VDPAVRVDGLVKTYGARTAVDGVSFTARPGSVLALLGPNGAGTTTTVETCEGFRSPDSGTVRVLGLDPVRDHAALAPRVGVMLQSGGVYPGAQPREVLRLFAAFHDDALDTDALLERLGLSASAGTPYRRLSGGQQQRLSLALAVVGRPEVAFLDEPTAGLDPQARRATWDLVRELRTDGVTVVLTTHAMDEAEALADDVVIVDRGRVVASGTPRTLTAGGERRFEAPAGQSIPGAVEEAPGSYVVRRTLEDVFLDLTGRELRS
jgi:ABC-2 type transport system ATP-binding protein